jgi:hypothetical protein
MTDPVQIEGQIINISNDWVCLKMYDQSLKMSTINFNPDSCSNGKFVCI